jgi:threonyl-tRNA synthetase
MSYVVVRRGERSEVDWDGPGDPSALDLLSKAGVPGRGPDRALAVKIGGAALDLSRKPGPGAELVVVDSRDPESLDLVRHSAAHVMAEAVIRLFPGAKVAIGPSIEDGFYYDFDVPEPFSPADLELVSKAMAEIIAEAQPMVRTEVGAEEAVKRFEAQGEPYKKEMAEDLLKSGERTVSLYQCGDFVDLCRGPHVPDTSAIGAFKLLSVAGAYWRGDERRPMLQRIYGTAFLNPKDL